MTQLLTSLWPYVLLIALVAWQGAAVDSVVVSIVGAAGATLLVTALDYALVGAPAGHRAMYTALFALSSSLPFLGAAIASYLAGRRNSIIASMILGLLVGLALLAPMRLMQMSYLRG